jgi:hypothetical protein
MRNYLKYSLILWLVFNIQLKAQVNLIQNGSFEILDSCVSQQFISNTIHYARGWDNACAFNVSDDLSSSDLFNTCNAGILGVPSNWYGYQEPFEGNGYAGIVINDLPQPSVGIREFMQNTLIMSIVANCKYKISFHFSYGTFGSYKTDGLQFIFSNSKLTIPNDAAILNGTYFTFDEDSVTIIRFPELLEADTTDWWYFEREFYSNAPAKYLTIGSILDSASINNVFGWIVPFGGVQGHSRGYFDDIRLVQLDSNCVTGVNEIEKKERVKVYPNPAKNSLTISIPNNEEEMFIEFIDVSGRIVKSINLNPSDKQVIGISSLSAGWYAISITRPISGRFVKPIFIEN